VRTDVHPDGKLKEAVQGYLACCSFTDAQLGKALDALKGSPYADRTIEVKQKQKSNRSVLVVAPDRKPARQLKYRLHLGTLITGMGYPS